MCFCNWLIKMGLKDFVDIVRVSHKIIHTIIAYSDYNIKNGYKYGQLVQKKDYKTNSSICQLELHKVSPTAVVSTLSFIKITSSRALRINDLLWKRFHHFNSR